MSSGKRSAEIVEIDDVRARRHPEELDPANFLAVGPYLEAVRQQQGGSLSAISSRIHVKLDYLEAIEAMAIDKLPSKAFAIGFVKTYADALGLSPDHIVQRFKEEAGYQSKSQVQPEQSPTPVASEPMGDIERPELSFLAVIAVLAFILWCAFWITRPRDVQAPFNFDAPTAANETAETAALAGFAPNVAALGAPAVVIEASAFEQIEPIYPPQCEAGAAPIETIGVAFTVTATGAVASERIIDASNPCFERAALNALRQWRFSPRTVDGAAKPAFDQRFQFQFHRPA